MARQGAAWLGMARQGERRGGAWPGAAWRGMAWQGKEKGEAWRGEVWLGTVWQATVRHQHGSEAKEAR